MAWSLARSMRQWSIAFSFLFTLNSGSVARPTGENDIPEGGVAFKRNRAAPTSARTMTMNTSSFLNLIVSFLRDFPVFALMMSLHNENHGDTVIVAETGKKLPV